MFDETFTLWHRQQHNTYKQLGRTLFVLWIIVPPIVIFFGTIFNTNTSAEISGTLSQLAGILFFMLSAFLYGWRLLLSSKLKKSLWDEFSKIHGLMQSEDVDGRSLKLAGPVVSSRAVTSFTRSVLSGVNDGLDFVLSSTNFGFNILDTKNSQLNDLTRYSFSYNILSVNTQTELPHIFIDGLSQNKYQRNATSMWSLPKRLSSKQRIGELEGDFHKFFSVYIADVDQREVSALSIVTPDVMLAMRDEGYAFDYEIHSKQLYVISEANIIDVDKFNAFIRATQTVVNEIIPQLAKQLRAESGKQLVVARKTVGFRVVWHSMTGYLRYAALYLVVIGVCGLAVQIAKDSF